MTSNYRPISVQYAFRSVTVAGLVATLLSYVTLEADIWGGGLLQHSLFQRPVRAPGLYE